MRTRGYNSEWRAVDFPAPTCVGSNFTAYKVFIAHCRRLLLNPHDLWSNKFDLFMPGVLRFRWYTLIVENKGFVKSFLFVWIPILVCHDLSFVKLEKASQSCHLQLSIMKYFNYVFVFKKLYRYLPKWILKTRLFL